MFRSMLDLVDALFPAGRTSRRRRGAARKATARLALDALEERWVPAIVSMTAAFDVDAFDGEARICVNGFAHDKLDAFPPKQRQEEEAHRKCKKRRDKTHPARALLAAALFDVQRFALLSLARVFIFFEQTHHRP